MPTSTLSNKDKLWDILELDTHANSFEKWVHRTLIFLIFARGIRESESLITNTSRFVPHVFV